LNNHNCVVVSFHIEQRFIFTTTAVLCCRSYQCIEVVLLIKGYVETKSAVGVFCVNKPFLLMPPT